jgi:opacity protein-like surface antigen
MSRILSRFALAVCVAFGIAFVDANSAHAKPVEYVKICNQYGAGFYYIPGTGCVQRRVPGSSWVWAGAGVGFTATDYRVNTIYQQTFNIFDPLSDDASAGLASTGFRGDIDFGWDTILGNWPNWPNIGWNWPNWPNMGQMPISLGIAATFGYSDTDKRVNRIPGSGLFTPNGPGTDYFRIQGGWEGSIGGRLGMFITPSFLVYGTGGVAFQRFKATINCGTGLCEPNGIPQTTLTQSQWRWGYYYGGGFMMPFPNLVGWTVGVELRETDYGDWTLTAGNSALYQGQYKADLSDFSATFRVHRNFTY